MVDVDWSQLAVSLEGMAHAQREAAEAQREAAEAQAEHYRQQRQAADAAEHNRLITAAPADAGEALGHAAAGRFSEALDTVTDTPMLGWLGQIVVYVVLAVTGVTGLPALLVRFGIPVALRLVGSKLKSAMHTEADDVADEIAERAAQRVAANGGGNHANS
jgi:hypothetical protein